MTAAPIPSRTGLALPRVLAVVLAVWLLLFSAQEAGAEQTARSASLVCLFEPRAMFPRGASGMSAIGAAAPHRLTLLTVHHATGPIDRYDSPSLLRVGRAASCLEMQFDNPPTFGSIDRCGAFEAPMTSAQFVYDAAPLLRVSRSGMATKPGTGALGVGGVYSAHSSGLAGVSAELAEGGTLELYIVRGKATPPGYQMFDEAVDAFGSNVNRIKGDWSATAGIDTNFNQFQAGLARGLTPAQAAASTWTGQNAARRGFGVVTGVRSGPGWVEAIFSKG
jgi:hypothetical protein